MDDRQNRREIPRERRALTFFQNQGIGLAPCHDSCSFWPEDLPNLVDTVMVQLVTGALSTGIDGVEFANHKGGTWRASGGVKIVGGRRKPEREK
jgi:hypothetical protein